MPQDSTLDSTPDETERREAQKTDSKLVDEGARQRKKSVDAENGMEVDSAGDAEPVD